ncbi:MAG TPA: TIGR01777 family oxidoreductase [Myxococcota bacterium]|nr:TIGR01777 family oxidoreductase [Myxococcota bacterium]HQK50856.1 TIGR01777 family oxidoreductase [Myxococcota bacterium]
MRWLITGATGFIGRRLVETAPGPVTVLARDPVQARRVLGPVDAFRWDALEGPPPREAFEGVEAVVHLAGESIAGRRWSGPYKEALSRSRSQGTRNLVMALQALPSRPAVLVSASAVGWYGDRGDEELVETSPPGRGFLAQVCQDWEREARGAEALGIRVVLARLGLVLGPGGGTVQAMLPLFRKGLGGPFGLGRQFLPWVALEDVLGLIRHAIETPAIRGPLNVTAPHPVRQRAFATALGRALGRPALLPAPTPLLRLVLGEFARELLASQRVLPQVALDTGYVFRLADLDEAIRAALR